MPTFFGDTIHRMCLVLFFAWAASGVFPSPPLSADKKKNGGGLSILTGPRGGQEFALGSVLADLLRQEGITARALVGGELDNLRLVGEDEADVGFTFYSFMRAAAEGEKELPDIDMDNAVLLANLYPQVLYIVVRKDVAEERNLRSLGDLLNQRGALRFATLPRGTGSEFIFSMLLKNAYRSGYDGLSEQGWEMHFISDAEIRRRFIAGDLDVCVYVAGPGTYLIPAFERSNTAAVLLSVEESALDLMTYQFMTVTHVIEKGDHESVDGEVLTLGDYSCLVTRRSLSDDMVRTINHLLWENRHELALGSRDILALSPRYAVAGQSRVHPASAAFWTTPAMMELKNIGRDHR